MLFTQADFHADIWQAVKHELHRGALDPKHPFRYVNLGTLGNGFPQVRKVVLRELTAEVEFLIFTDFRSEKVKEIQNSPKVTLHFYHPKKMLQVRVEAKVEIHFQDELSERSWKGIPEVRRSEYTGTLPPGKMILSPDLGWDLGEKSFFTVLKISPQRIEALQLSRQGHLRIQFEKSKDWKGEWLVP
jgi:pyridoxamine 5'-phosphate oxidase